MPKAAASPKITTYIKAAMSTMEIKILEDGTYYAEIPSCPGVWANEDKKETCKATLQEVLEEWIILKLWDNDALPVIKSIDLDYTVEEA